MKKQVSKNKITVDLAKNHLKDNRCNDILRNDIKKLIEIIENEKYSY